MPPAHAAPGSPEPGRRLQEVSLFGKILTERVHGLIVNGVLGKGTCIGSIKRIAALKVEGAVGRPGEFRPHDPGSESGISGRTTAG